MDNDSLKSIFGLAFLAFLFYYSNKRRNKHHSKKCPRCGYFPCKPKTTGLVYKGTGGYPVYDYKCPSCGYKFTNSSDVL